MPNLRPLREEPETSDLFAKSFFTTRELAKLLNMSTSRLKALRGAGKGIPYYKFQKSVRYAPPMVKQYIDSCKRYSTSQTKPLEDY